MHWTLNPGNGVRAPGGVRDRLAGVAQPGRGRELKTRARAGSRPAARTIPRSSSGRTTDSDSVNRGSNPCLGASPPRTAAAPLSYGGWPGSAPGGGLHVLVLQLAERPAQEAGCCGFDSRRAHALRTGVRQLLVRAARPVRLWGRALFPRWVWLPELAGLRRRAANPPAGQAVSRPVSPAVSISPFASARTVPR